MGPTLDSGMRQPKKLRNRRPGDLPVLGAERRRRIICMGAVGTPPTRSILLVAPVIGGASYAVDFRDVLDAKVSQVCEGTDSARGDEPRPAEVKAWCRWPLTR